MKTQQQADRIKGGSDGWIPANETWSFGSADQPMYELTIPGDTTSKYSPGMKLKCEQSRPLTSYWPLNANVNDLVGSDSGVAYGSPTFTPGKFSVNALTLNGVDQFVAFADSSNLKPIGDFTIGFWVKTGVSETSIFASRNYGDTGFINGLIVYLTAGKVLLQVGNNTGNTLGDNFWDVMGSTTVTDGVWHYIVITASFIAAQIYVDGKLDATGMYISPVYPTINYPRIGDVNDGSGEILHFNGQIQDFFLDNGYAWAEQAIKSKYLLGVPQGISSVTLIKNFIVHDSSYSSPNTTLAVYGGTDFALTNTAISNPMYSVVSNPFGFNANPDKWSLTFIDIVNRGVTSPTVNTAYNLGAFGMFIPKGIWNISVKSTIGAQLVGQECVFLGGLSRDVSLNIIPEFSMLCGAYQLADVLVRVEGVFVANVKTQLYMIGYSNRIGMDFLFIDNQYSAFILKVTSVYI